MISLALGPGAHIDLHFTEDGRVSFGVLCHKIGRKNCFVQVVGIEDMPHGYQGGPWSCTACGRVLEIVRSSLRVAPQAGSTYASKFKRKGLRVIR